MKKLMKDILMIIAAFILFVIWYNNKINYVVPASSLVKQKIYLITLDKVEEFAYIINEGVSDMAKLAGVTYIWDAPKVRGVEEQIDVINAAVRDGADLIMLVAIDPVKISNVIKDAKAKGVKIIYIDSPAIEEAITTLATDNYSAGKIAGEVMISELVSVGKSSGSIGIVGVTPVIETTTNRERGFREVIEQDGRFQLLETKFAEANPIISQNAADTFINENIDLVGLFATNEGSTVGVGYAIQESNKQIIGIGFDITDEIREMIRNEILQAVLVQNPYTMGYLSMAEAIAAIKGYDTGPSFINTGVSIITKYSW